MTAEIAVLNKLAIALAADSAATVSSARGNKSYHTANKLFALSNSAPVGLMVYGAAEFMGIPWETIVKMYRGNLGRKRFNRLAEYSSDFMDFLRKQKGLFPEDVQKFHIIGSIHGYYEYLKNHINDKVHGQLPIDRNDVPEIVTSIINTHHAKWKKAELLPDFDISFAAKIAAEYLDEIEKIITETFEALPLSKASRRKLIEIAGLLFIKNNFPQNISGLVIAGFGEAEHYPGLSRYIIEMRIKNLLKYREDPPVTVNLESNAAIIPFAQSEMVTLFMEGVHPQFLASLNSYLKELFEKYPQLVVENISVLSDKEKQNVLHGLTSFGVEELKNFGEKMQAFRRKIYVEPILNAVAVLPVDELAAMAESLINLTSFKQKISLETETVGGPIDVAVITKGDGFIWIKRKQYFRPELNPHADVNYYWNELGGKDLRYEKKSG